MRIADGASDTEAQAARDAAARLQEVVREADTEAEAGDKSPREALESLGRELAVRPGVGPLVLAITQIALWAACRLRCWATPARTDVWSQAPGGSFDWRRALCCSPGPRPT